MPPRSPGPAAAKARYSRRVPGGSPDVARLLEEATQAMIHAAAKELFTIANEVMTEAVEVYVPVEDGYLRDSGVVGSPEQVAGGGVRVRLGFGGPSAMYAVFVHEDPEARHGAAIGKPAGQQYKFLEKPALEKAAEIPDRVASAMRSAL